MGFDQVKPNQPNLKRAIFKALRLDFLAKSGLAPSFPLSHIRDC